MQPHHNKHPNLRQDLRFHPAATESYEEAFWNPAPAQNMRLNQNGPSLDRRQPSRPMDAGTSHNVPRANSALEFENYGHRILPPIQEDLFPQSQDSAQQWSGGGDVYEQFMGSQDQFSSQEQFSDSYEPLINQHSNQHEDHLISNTVTGHGDSEFDQLVSEDGSSNLERGSVVDSGQSNNQFQSDTPVTPNGAQTNEEEESGSDDGSEYSPTERSTSPTSYVSAQRAVQAPPGNKTTVMTSITRQTFLPPSTTFGTTPKKVARRSPGIHRSPSLPPPGRSRKTVNPPKFRDDINIQFGSEKQFQSHSGHLEKMDALVPQPTLGPAYKTSEKHPPSPQEEVPIASDPPSPNVPALDYPAEGDAVNTQHHSSENSSDEGEPEDDNPTKSEKGRRPKWKVEKVDDLCATVRKLFQTVSKDTRIGYIDLVREVTRKILPLNAQSEKHYYNMFQSMVATDKEFDRNTIGRKWEAFKESTPNFREFLDAFHDMNVMEKGETTIRQRKKNFAASCSKLIQTFDSLSHIWSFEGVWALAGNNGDIDTFGSSAQFFESDGAKGFFEERCHMPNDRVMSHLRAHIHDRQSRKEIEEAWLEGETAPDSANNEAHGDKLEVDETFVRQKIYVRGQPETVSDSATTNMCALLKFKGVGYRGKGGGTAKMFPWKTLAPALKDEKMRIEGWPYSARLPGSVMAKESFSGLNTKEQESLALALEDGSLKVVPWKKEESKDDAVLIRTSLSDSKPRMWNEIKTDLQIHSYSLETNEPSATRPITRSTKSADPAKVDPPPLADSLPPTIPIQKPRPKRKAADSAETPNDAVPKDSEVSAAEPIAKRTKTRMTESGKLPVSSTHATFDDTSGEREGATGDGMNHRVHFETKLGATGGYDPIANAEPRPVHARRLDRERERDQHARIQSGPQTYAREGPEFNRLVQLQAPQFIPPEFHRQPAAVQKPKVQVGAASDGNQQRRRREHHAEPHASSSNVPQNIYPQPTPQTNTLNHLPPPRKRNHDHSKHQSKQRRDGNAVSMPPPPNLYAPPPPTVRLDSKNKGKEPQR